MKGTLATRASSSAMVLVLLCACETPNGASLPGTPEPPPPAAGKWEGPEKAAFNGSRFRTTIYYGPWQCTQAFMNDCSEKCAAQAHLLMGCIWLADLKMDWEGPVGFSLGAGGTRFAVTHCCCDYPKLPPAENALQRRKWDTFREPFRKRWGDRFGEWPKDSAGNHWPGHHVRDLQHGGDPIDAENIFPMPASIHDSFRDVYPQCYSGTGAWKAVGPPRPYAD